MTTKEIACPSCGARNRVPNMASGKPSCGKCKTDLPWLVDVGSREFYEVIDGSSLPVLVDLWAPWCGPCRVVAPALESLARERAGSLRVVKVNVDDAPTISAGLGVRGIPTMVLYRDGTEMGRQVGAMPGARIAGWVDALLNSPARG